MISNSIAAAPNIPMVLGVPVDFILFGLTLLGVALFHHHTLRVALTGLLTIAAYKTLFTGFKTGPGASGFLFHLGHEWVILSRSEEHTSELQSLAYLVCRLLLEK